VSTLGIFLKQFKFEIMNSKHTPKTVNEVIDIINNSAASMFTKCDVIELVKSMQTVPDGHTEITDEHVSALIEYVRHEMYVNIDESDMYDKESAQFEIEDGNEIVLTEIDIDTDHAIDVATEAIREWCDRNIL
jgi:hypothetical protein